ncbi:MAG TPA: NapC/NirT family cytochrome c [Terriglobia bacterium]|nr:NapC/NirT family cytochrome c [Terriglobia bacterium]
MGTPSDSGLREQVAVWFRPAVFLGHNAITLLGAILTTSSALTLLFFWALLILRGGPVHPYTGIIFFLILPGFFVAGLVLMPLGVVWRRARLRKAGSLPTVYPKIDLREPVLRRAAGFVLGLSIANMTILGTASYQGVEYMDTVQFCGQTCHTVMQPEFTAYERSPHQRVACVECHIGPGASFFVRSKLSGVRQVFAVSFRTYSTPIPSPVENLRPARETCEQCHWPERFSGDKLEVIPKFGDDEKNTATKTVLLMHIGGRNLDRKLVGIHGAHLGLVTYIPADRKRQTSPWVSHRNADGATTDFASTDTPPSRDLLSQGERRTMDCMDCHNRPSHVFYLPERAVDREMAAGRIDASLPFIHKVAVELLKRTYASRSSAEIQIPEDLREYYRKNYFNVYNSRRAQVEQAAQALVYVYDGNVFPAMGVTWGTYPNNLGHADFPGCFRCHDGNHKSSDGKEITQDCNTCHSLLAMEEEKPKILQELYGGN